MIKFIIFIIVGAIISEVILRKIENKNNRVDNFQYNVNNDNSSRSNYINQPVSRELSHENWKLFNNSIVIKEHFKNIEDIENKYKVLYNLKDFFGPRMDNLIAHCERDISIAEEYIAVHHRFGQQIPPSYVSFKRLAIIYEKRQEYDAGIEVCLKAIKLGFTDNGDMYGRVARLLRKSGRIEEADKYQQIKDKN